MNIKDRKLTEAYVNQKYMLIGKQVQILTWIQYVLAVSMVLMVIRGKITSLAPLLSISFIQLYKWKVAIKIDYYPNNLTTNLKIAFDNLDKSYLKKQIIKDENCRYTVRKNFYIKNKTIQLFRLHKWHRVLKLHKEDMIFTEEYLIYIRKCGIRYIRYKDVTIKANRVLFKDDKIRPKESTFRGYEWVDTGNNNEGASNSKKVALLEYGEIIINIVDMEPIVLSLSSMSAFKECIKHLELTGILNIDKQEEIGESLYEVI